MIKNGDKIEINGVVASVEAIWAQGRHTSYKLSDGRTVLDLEALVQSGGAKRIASVTPQSRPSFTPQDSRRFEENRRKMNEDERD